MRRPCRNIVAQSGSATAGSYYANRGCSRVSQHPLGRSQRPRSLSSNEEKMSRNTLARIDLDNLLRSVLVLDIGQDSGAQASYRQLASALKHRCLQRGVARIMHFLAGQTPPRLHVITSLFGKRQCICNPLLRRHIIHNCRESYSIG
jgi:hypothetical protein